MENPWYYYEITGSARKQGLQENIPSDAVKLVELFALQELACESLTKKEERTNKKGIKYDTYVHRVNYCLRQRIDALKLVSVRYNQKRESPLRQRTALWQCMDLSILCS